MKAKRRLLIAACALALVTVCIIFLYNQNNSIDIEEFHISAPSGCAGLRVLHLSDIHLPKNAATVEVLIEKAAALKPDLIALTGDTIDMGADVSTCGLDQLIEGLCTIAPTYAVLGNHEYRNEGLVEFKKVLESAGAHLLINDVALFEKDSSRLAIVGLDDAEPYDTGIAANLDGAPMLLLAHRPEEELYLSYSQPENGPFLTLTGHAHGGQIRLPFIGGLYAPNQGFLPKYTNGLYEDNGSAMLVSRGLGNSLFPQRLFNRPHMILISLEADE